jgi:hypothetical protein
MLLRAGYSARYPLDTREPTTLPLESGSQSRQPVVVRSFLSGRKNSVEVGMAQGSDGIWEIARSFFVRYGRFASAARTAVLILKTAILSTEISGSVSEISVNFMSYINEL